jgi:hypothetical protein
VRTLGRRTGIRRPPKVTEPSSCPWRTTARSGSWRPFRPANTVTSASIIAYMTCKPAPTARASRPSFADSAISPNDTNTSAGIAGARLVSTCFFW